MTTTDSIIAHYGTDDLVTRVEDALAKAGLGGTLSARELEGLDQFHFRALAATEELGRAMELAPHAEVLDIGCGLGGPARYLAGTYAAHVTGIDLNASFIALGQKLTGRVVLEGTVDLLEANALELPFPDASFDHALTQHVAMNIADRDRLYAEARRVLRPHGRLAIYDVIAGDGGEIVFPVPWAREPSASHLVDAAELRAVLERSGFLELSWRDTTAEGLAWFETFSKQPPAFPGLGLVMGADFPAMARNFAQNLKDGRARLVQTIVERT